jgi:hypothetical protein
MTTIHALVDNLKTNLDEQIPDISGLFYNSEEEYELPSYETTFHGQTITLLDFEWIYDNESVIQLFSGGFLVLIFTFMNYHNFLRLFGGKDND